MVSIIVPIYNTAEYLPACLDSLLNQTDSAWEAILVDDASTDNSLAVVLQYAKADTRFHVLRHEKNRGLSATRNTGMTIAGGEWLAFLDSDDTLENDWVEQMTRNIGENDLLQAGYKRVSETNEVLLTSCPTQRRRFTLTSACMRLYRRSYIEQHKLSFTEGMLYEDVLFSTRLWKTGPKIRVIQYTGYRYRVNTASITSKPHNTDIIRRALREEKIGLFRFNALRMRLAAHFLKERIMHLFG